MGRAIKFRAWDTENARYFEPTYQAYKGNLKDLVIGMGGDLCMWTGRLEHESFPNRFIIEQFTGFTDKGGKEIYVGDVVQFDDGNPENCSGAEVEWLDAICGYVFRYGTGSGEWEDIQDWNPNYTYLIGNIHDKESKDE